MTAIPKLDQLDGLRARYIAFLDALEASAFAGDVHRDAATRLVTATDNSVYQILPQAVVYPASAADVATFVQLASSDEFKRVTFTPRGGGTGTNGQSLSEGVIVDVSRHMNRVVELNIAEGWVRVEPGVVLDQLNRYLEPHGVFFAPSLSPSSRATLGGMIATDACGKGSRIYGRTSDHVLGLSTVLSDGTPWQTTPLDRDALTNVQSRDDAVGRVHREVHAVVIEHAAAIARDLPKLGKRFLTGYDLAHVWDDETEVFDLSRIITGSEGTLAIVTEAKLALTPIPAHRQLVVLRYSSFDDALASAQTLVELDPGAIETIDETVLALAREDVIWHRVRGLIDRQGGPRFSSINLIEFESHDRGLIQERVDALMASVDKERGQPGKPVGATLATTAEESSALWDLRKKGVGLLANSPGTRKPIAFVEDTVVPPERLPEFVREFRALLDDAGLTYGMFGHIDVGCLHVRPALDMKDADDEARLRRISDAVANLVQRHGGVIWGEHGKGFRSEYNPQFFGEELYGALRRVKGVFDPRNVLNPGKLASPASLPYDDLVSIDATKRGTFDRQLPVPVRQRWPVALDCNGNGQCFDVDPDHVMCPSSKVTRDRIHSPKGRAGVMREWLRQLQVAGYDPVEGLAGSRGGGGLVGWFRRRLAGWRRRRGEYDYSHEVHQAMSGCLACKACATQCPVRVDVPAMRSDFLALYHSRYPRPLRDHLIGGLEATLPLLAMAPRLVNRLLGLGPVARLIERVVGMVDTPPLSVPGAQAGLASREIPPFDYRRLRELSREERADTVVLFQDAFTRYYEAPVMLAAVDLLRRMGRNVEVMPYTASGKGLHVRGFLREFEVLARRNADALAVMADLEIPVVGLDPAVVLAFRDEYVHALGAESAASFRVLLLQEYLSEHVRDIPIAAGAGTRYTLMAHCTERTAETTSTDRWRATFAAAGLELDVRAVGCCGMCGAYGHEADHVEESRGIYDMSWERHLPDAPEARALTLATGHSCRSQVKRFSGWIPRHPVEALVAEIGPDE